MKYKLQNFKWEYYIWLAYLPYTFITYFPIKTASDKFWILIIGLFLIDYILVAEFPKYRLVTVPLELMITGTFVIFQLNFYLIIFTAWQCSFVLSSYKKRWYILFITVYYLIMVSGFWLARCKYPDYNFSPTEAFGLVFPVISPIMSYVFAVSIRNRRRLRQNNRRLESIVRRGERERIARDLHDSLGQSFSMITIKSQLAEKLWEKGSPQVLQELKDIEQASRDNLALVRKIVTNLHQQTLSEMLLNQEKNLKNSGVFLITEHEAQALEWPTEVQYYLASVIQEAITNIIRHAKASEVQIIFIEKTTNYQIYIQDNGRSRLKNYERDGSHGIAGMKARMQEQSGTFEIKRNDIGTLVILVFPKER